jgi:ribonuclease HI
VGSNNEAEVMAMTEGVNLVEELLLVEGKGKNVLIRGDSDLVIKFMNKVYKPHKKVLAVTIQQTREKLKTLKGIKIRFEHVPRANNAWADFLS